MMSPPRGLTWSCRRQTSSLKATSVFLTLSHLSDEGAEVPAGDMMANADVRLAIRKNTRLVTALPNAALTAPRNVV